MQRSTPNIDHKSNGPRNYPDADRIRVILAMLVGLTLASTSLAQEQPNEPADRKTKGSRLVMVLKSIDETGNILTKEFLQDLIIQAIKRTEGRCTILGTPVVQEIDPSFFANLDRLIRSTESKNATEQKVRRLETKDFIVEPEPILEGDFPHVPRLKMKEPGAYLKNLTVTYAGGKEDTITDLDKKRIQSLGVDDNGCYEYRIALSDRPVSYKITAEKDKSEETKNSGTWPADEVHFAVTLHGLNGDPSELRKWLVEKNVNPITNPFKSLDEVSDTRFLVGNYNVPDNKQSMALNNKLELVLRDETNSVQRVWLKLPLSSADLERDSAKFVEARDPKRMIELMKSDGWDENQSGKIVVIAPDTVAAWVEMTASGGNSFRIEIPLRDSAEIRKKFADMRYIIVRQNGKGDEARAVGVPGKENGKYVFFRGDQFLDPDVYQPKAVQKPEAK